MSPVTYEQIVALLGLVAIWALWYYLWRPQRVAAFRERLFALRDNLFDLAADGVIPFNHPAYTQLRMLVNGMIRFAHRATLPTLIFAASQSRHAPANVFESWQKSVNGLPEVPREKVLEVYGRVSEAFAKQIFSGSPVLWVLVGARVAFLVARSLFMLLTGRKTLRDLTVDGARRRVGYEECRVTKTATKAIEVRVLYEEQKRVKYESRRGSPAGDAPVLV